MLEFNAPQLGRGNESFALLAETERRYRKDRLRLGPKAMTLPDEEEEKVIAATEAACEVYEETTEEERAKIREFFRCSYSLRYRVAKVAGRHHKAFAKDGSPRELRKTLIALSVENAETDGRDTLATLARLREQTSNLGFDEDRIFEDVALISSERMQRFLRHKGGPIDLR